MKRLWIGLAALAAGCAAPIAPLAPNAAAAPETTAVAAGTGAAAGAGAAAVTAAPCTGPESRQLDFWIGDWDLQIRARSRPDADAWADAHGTNQIRATLGGCVIEEHFQADGPGQPWSGQSVSTYVAAMGVWRQTWVDDQGSYLAFRGGREGDAVILAGEPREKDGRSVQMRMAFRNITRDAFVWTWESGSPGGSDWTPMLIIRYARRAGTSGPGPR